MTALLLRHGVLHSAQHPFATALLVDDTVIAWIGDEDTADHRAAQADRVIDLDGALVAPRFVSMPTTDALDARHAQGGVPGALETARHQVEGGDLAPTDLARTLRRRGLALLVDGAVPLDLLDTLVSWGITLLVDLSGENAPAIPLAAVARAGVPYVLLDTVGESPWDTTRRAVHGMRLENRVTARSAFRAQTRAAWRFVGDYDAGEIGVGRRSELSVWRAKSVGVEDATTGVGSFSTDARSGTPLLPVLGSAGPLPGRVMDVVGTDLISEPV